MKRDWFLYDHVVIDFEGQTTPIELGKTAEESTVEAVKVSHLR